MLVWNCALISFYVDIRARNIIYWTLHFLHSYIVKFNACECKVKKYNSKERNEKLLIINYWLWLFSTNPKPKMKAFSHTVMAKHKFPKVSLEHLDIVEIFFLVSYFFCILCLSQHTCGDISNSWKNTRYVMYGSMETWAKII